MKTFFLLLLLLLAVNTTPASAEPDADKKITIGATLPLTGKLAFSGLASQRGLELAVEHINNTGGILGTKLLLTVDDNGGEPSRAVSGMTKLLTVNHIDVAFSSTSHITHSIKSIVQRHAKIMLYAASVGDIAAENPLAFRDWADIDEQFTLLAAAIVKNKAVKVSFVSEQSEACIAGMKTLKTILTDKSVAIVAEETFNPGETDFRTLLLKAAAKGPQAFAVCAWRDSGLIMKQLKESGLIAIPTFHALAPFLPVNDTPEIRQLYEENKSQTAWLGTLPGATPAGPAGTFYREYFERYHEAARIEAAFAYDDVIVLAQALRTCRGITDTSCVANAIKTTVYDGAGGKLSFDDKRRSFREGFMMGIKNTQWVKLE